MLAYEANDKDERCRHGRGGTDLQEICLLLPFSALDSLSR